MKMPKIISDFLSGSKASEAPKAYAYLYSPGNPIYTERNYSKLAREAFEFNVTVYRCIMEVAGSVAQLDWEATIMRGKDQVELPEGHRMSKLLKRANEKQSFREMIESHTAFFLLSGNSYMEAVGPGDVGQPLKSEPLELYTQRPDRIKIIPNAVGGVAKYRYDAGAGKAVDYDPSRMMHNKSFNPTSDWYGLSAIQVAGRIIDSDNQAVSWNLSLLQNNGRPSGMLWSKGSLSDEQLNRLKKEVEDKYQGPQNAGRIMVADGENGVEWKEMGMSPSEMSWLEGRKLSRLEICQAFQVPPELIGDGESKTYSNYQEARRSFYLETVLPLADRMCDDLTGFLEPLFNEGITIGYDKNQIEALAEELDKKATRNREDVKAGIMTINEARAEAGRPPSADPNADLLLIPINLLPSDLAPVDGAPIKGIEGMDAKAIEWKKFDRKREAMARRMLPLVEAQLRNDAQDAADAVRKTDKSRMEEAAGHSIALNKDQWAKSLTKLYKSVAAEFGRATLESLKCDDMPEIKSEEDTFHAEVDRYVKSIVGNKVSEISAASMKSIRLAIKKGLDAGEGADQIADRVSAAGAFTKGRALRIARTETLAASNLGNNEAAKATGLDLIKEWVTTKDDRTRGDDPADPFDHLDADGQTQKLDDSFNVSGESLDFPGDSSHGASAGNIINCRCATVFRRA